LFPFIVGDKVTYLQARRPDGGQAKRWLCPSHLPPPLFNADTLTTAGTTITLCEGVTDVLSAFELGKDAVGLLGASSRLDGQMVALFRGRNLAVLGDADKAGRSFAQRMSALFAPHGLTIIRKRLPPGCNDLNDYLLATRKTDHELA
jgi:DNA primase